MLTQVKRHRNILMGIALHVFNLQYTGYNIPFHPLRLLGFIYGGPKMHDFHHQIHGRQANFGGYKFWDWLMGTDKKYHEWQQKHQKKST